MVIIGGNGYGDSLNSWADRALLPWYGNWLRRKNPNLNLLNFT